MAAMGNSSTVITGHLYLSFFWLAATRSSRGARHREAPGGPLGSKALVIYRI